jgi:hypothetical protein
MCQELSESKVVLKVDGSRPKYDEFRRHLFNGGMEDIISWYNQMLIIKRRRRLSQ